jgi:ribonuclease G
MTRKRTRDTLTRTMCEPCPYCEGIGRIKSVETVSFEVIREVQKMMKRTQAQKITIFAHPEVCAKLSSEDFGIIEALEETHNKTLLVRADNNYHSEQYEIYAPES